MLLSQDHSFFLASYTHISRMLVGNYDSVSTALLLWFPGVLTSQVCTILCLQAHKLCILKLLDTTHLIILL